MKDRVLLDWTAMNDQVMVSAIFGCSFVITSGGSCQLLDGFELQEAPRYAEAGGEQSACLLRDTDYYPWRQHTDLVVQGVARSPRPTQRMNLRLACRGASTNFAIDLLVSGDRAIETLHGRPRLPTPLEFCEMPLTYERAYGGTDVRALARHRNPARERLLGELLEAPGPRPSTRFSYPRNPAGRGYVVDGESFEGICCPNVEFCGQELRDEHLVSSLGGWGTRPYPASFDWFAHGWFPRIGFMGVFPSRGQTTMPSAEVELGLMPAGPARTRISGQRRFAFFQGAHPYLWRRRLTGDEHIHVDRIGPDGAPLEVQLPKLRPEVSLRVPGQRQQRRAAELDLVLIEGELRRVTLVWRASFAVESASPSTAWLREAPFELHGAW